MGRSPHKPTTLAPTILEKLWSTKSVHRRRGSCQCRLHLPVNYSRSTNSHSIIVAQVVRWILAVGFHASDLEGLTHLQMSLATATKASSLPAKLPWQKLEQVRFQGQETQESTLLKCRLLPSPLILASQSIRSCNWCPLAATHYDIPTRHPQIDQSRA